MPTVQALAVCCCSFLRKYLSRFCAARRSLTSGRCWYSFHQYLSRACAARRAFTSGLAWYAFTCSARYAFTSSRCRRASHRAFTSLQVSPGTPSPALRSALTKCDMKQSYQSHTEPVNILVIGTWVGFIKLLDLKSVKFQLMKNSS